MALAMFAAVTGYAAADMDEPPLPGAVNLLQAWRRF